jgi:DNA-directed RNA polymerase
VKMYEKNDVLAQVLEKARKDLGETNVTRLPDVPQSGEFDIKQVLKAEFGFA